MRPTTARLSDTHAEATTDTRNVDIRDVPMPGYFGKGSNNTPRDPEAETQRSVLAMLEAHATKACSRTRDGVLTAVTAGAFGSLS